MAFSVDGDENRVKSFLEPKQLVVTPLECEQVRGI